MGRLGVGRMGPGGVLFLHREPDGRGPWVLWPTLREWTAESDSPSRVTGETTPPEESRGLSEMKYIRLPSPLVRLESHRLHMSTCPTRDLVSSSQKVYLLVLFPRGSLTRHVIETETWSRELVFHCSVVGVSTL